MEKLLFFGDSITDSNRGRTNRLDIGDGYVRYIADVLPDVEIINRGINGERVRDLLIRLERDVLLEKPDLVTLFIGINDTWRKFEGDDGTYWEFERDYRYLIETMQAAGIKVIVVLPYLLETQDVLYTWRADLNLRIELIRNLAQEYRCPFIPLDTVMQSYTTCFSKRELAEDGVHPSDVGKGIIASTWLSYYQNLK